jgi:hypothetical protein
MLISRDLDITTDEAYQVMIASASYGAMMYPHEEDDDELDSILEKNAHMFGKGGPSNPVSNIQPTR